VIRSTYNPVVRTAEMDILRPVMTTELLVLDDIGAEKPSEWVEETMNLIITTRYNEKRITISRRITRRAGRDGSGLPQGARRLPAAFPAARNVRVP
jgi:DNA replication protein DnaC